MPSIRTVASHSQADREPNLLQKAAYPLGNARCHCRTPPVPMDASQIQVLGHLSNSPYNCWSFFGLGKSHPKLTQSSPERFGDMTRGCCCTTLPLTIMAVEARRRPHRNLATALIFFHRGCDSTEGTDGPRPRYTVCATLCAIPHFVLTRPGKRHTWSL